MIHVTALAGAIIWLGLNGLLWYTRPSDLLWLLVVALRDALLNAEQSDRIGEEWIAEITQRKSNRLDVTAHSTRGTPDGRHQRSAENTSVRWQRSRS
jgi:hypothetical protein